MNDKQYEEYGLLKIETDYMKRFIDWCENKFRSRIVGRKYFVSLKRKKFGFLGDFEIDLPIEVQNEIVEILKRHVEQNERKMEQL